MRQWCLNLMAVFALLALPLVGCSGSDNGGAGGDAGAGGSAGSGGTAGTAGTAGGGGAGGNGSTATQSWSGQGDGEDGPFTVCLTVNEDGTMLVFDGEGDCEWSFEVQFESCDSPTDGWASGEDIPIVNGAFSDSIQFREISGTFDGNTVSGDVTITTCSGSWTATPDP